MYQIDAERAQRQHCWNHGPQAEPKCRAGTCVYVYSSEPRPLPSHGRPKFRNNVPYPRGMADYYSLMWDGRIYRGKPNKKRPEKNFIECFNVRKPKTLVRPPKFIYERPPSPAPVRRGSYDGKPETNLEELDPHLIEDEHEVVELEATLELPQCPSLNKTHAGNDKATEILLGELFDFDHLVVPILENLVGQVVERAIHELLEEEELESLRTQQSNFENLRLKEQLKLIELKEQHDRLEAEKSRLDAETKAYVQFNKDVTNRIEAVAFTSLYLGDPLLDALDALRNQNKEGELQILISTIFNPWMNRFTQIEVKNQLLCRDLLDDIILSRVGRREAEFFMGKWNQEQEELRQQRLALSNQVILGEDEYGAE